MEDARSQLFLEYVRILKDKQRLFFLTENVSGMRRKTSSCVAFNHYER
ncbi:MULTISPECIES: DNA cytosine methyltransferase [Leptolyngbya]